MKPINPSAAGLVLLCSVEGQITRVLHNSLASATADRSDMSLVELTAPASVDKLDRFLRTVRTRGAAFDWQFRLACDDDRRLPVYLSGTLCEGALVVFVTPVDERPAHAVEPEGGGAEQGPAIHCVWGGDVGYEALAQVNNDLANMQREMAKKNVELEKANRSLEQMRTELEQRQLQLTEANEKLVRLALYDGLTGVVNRRAFESILEEWHTAARQEGDPLSLMLLDVDHFKAFNDEHGHQAGDAALEHVARVLESCARRGDVVARYGGEEFAVILQQTSQAEAMRIAERFRRAVAESECPGQVITISVGVASGEVEAITPKVLIEQADRALYVSKEQGRNRSSHWCDLDCNRASSPCRLPADAGVRAHVASGERGG